MTGNRMADTIIALLYMGGLLLLATRPAWWDRIVSRAKRFAGRDVP